MKLGAITVASDEALALTRELEFATVQIPVGAGTPLDVVSMTTDERAALKARVQSYGLGISSLGFFDNLLDEDESVAQAAVDYTIGAIEAAPELGSPIVSVFAGRDKSLSISQNIPKFKETFDTLTAAAERVGVKIAIENCPMIDRHLQMPVNLAYSPELWGKLFEAVPSNSLGLEYDPSHFIGLHIDYLRAFEDFSDRVFHFHAKDMEVLPEVLGRSGVFGSYSVTPGEFGAGYDRFRAPGWGVVDWRKLLSLVISSGYDGSITVENEDPVFSEPFKPKVAVNGYTVAEHFGTQREALRQARDFLRSLVPLER